MITLKIDGEAEFELRACARQLEIDLETYLRTTLWVTAHLVKRGSLVTTPGKVHDASLLVKEREEGDSFTDIQIDWPSGESMPSVTVH